MAPVPYLRRFQWLILILPLFCSLHSVSAQQPFYTDDADVTPRGRFHFEASNEHDWLQAAALPNLRQNTSDFELGYGLFDGFEVSVSVPFIMLLNSRGTTPRSLSGFGDTNLSAKYNFLKERERSKLPAMSISVNLELPTGDASRQLGSGLADFYVNGILQKSLNKMTKLRLNGGVLFSGNEATGVIGIRTRGTVFTGGVSVVRNVTSRLDLGAELVGAVTRNLDLGKGQLQGQFGGNYRVRKNMTIDFGVIAGKYVASPRVGFQLGLSLDW